MAAISSKVRLPWLKPGVLIGALVPLALLIYRAGRGTLGADPIAIAMNQLGLLALIFLLASLCATPLRFLLGLSWPIRIRRLLGLLAFLYATLHFLLYVLVDQGLVLPAIVADITQRKFITVGFVAWLLLVPLALTSNNAMHKRLGPLRWQRLHRLSYVIAVLGVVHFVWRVKRDLSQPMAYGAVLGLLFLLRIVQRKTPRPGRERGVIT